MHFTQYHFKVEIFFSYLFFPVLINQHRVSHYVKFDWISHFLGWYLPIQSNLAIIQIRKHVVSEVRFGSLFR